MLETLKHRGAKYQIAFTSRWTVCGCEERIQFCHQYADSTKKQKIARSGWFSPVAESAPPVTFKFIMPIKVAMIGAGSVGFTRGLMKDILGVPELADTEFAFTDLFQDQSGDGRRPCANGTSRKTNCLPRFESFNQPSGNA